MQRTKDSSEFNKRSARPSSRRVNEKEQKRKRKDYACQVWPRALRKGHLKGRAPPHRPRGIQRRSTRLFR
eukprot:1147996-Pelagomonas_calceolata.AAC.7